MKIKTSIEGENVERKQHTEASLYSSLANALIVPDVVSGQDFGAVGLKMIPLRPSSDNRVEYIQSEYDPSALSQLKALYARRDSVRTELARLAERVSPEHYHRLVRDNTIGYRVIKIVKAWKRVSAYEWSIEHGHWETIQDEERITRTEFYERLIRYGHLSLAALKSAYQCLRQSRLVDEIARKNGVEIARSYIWRTNPRTIRVRNIPLWDGNSKAIPEGANLHDYDMKPQPVYGTKEVPTIDWDHVRKSWIQRLGEIQPKQEALVQELRAIEDQMLDLRPSSTHRFNRCVQLSGAAFRSSYRNTQLLSESIVGDTFPRLQLEQNGSSTYLPIGWLPGDPTSRLVLGGSTETYLYPETVPGLDGFVAVLSDIDRQCQEFDPDKSNYPTVPQSWEKLGNPSYYHGGNHSAYLSVGQPMSVTRHLDFDPTVAHSIVSRLVSGSEGDPICLQDNENRPEELDEKIQTNLNALLAGRASGAEDTTFNMARSLGELKDLPRTGSQSADFVRWLLTTGSKEQLYAFKIKGHTTPLYAPLRDFIKSKRTLYGIKVASYKAISRTPPLAILASAYLGWKFAIEPTIADINRVGRESYRDLIASRRFLTRLYRKLDTRTRFVVLRRGFLIGKPVHQDKPIILTDGKQIPRLDTPYRDGLFFSRQQVIAIMNCDAAPFCAATLPGESGKASITVPYVLTRKGLRHYLWFATDGHYLTYSERRRCAMDSYRRARDFLPVEFYANPFLYQSWLKGCVFARYGRNTLKSLAEDSSLAAKLDRLKIVKTAWDLSPLSFILEWFTNLGDIIQNAQDILSADSVGITPIGGPWCRVTERFAISRLTAPQRYHLTQRLISAEYYPMLRITQSRGERRFLNARAEMVPARLEWEWSVVDNTTGRLIDRADWLTELQPCLKKTAAAVTNRMPISWERELPEFRPSLRLDIGKGLTLLAMYLAGLRK